MKKLYIFLFSFLFINAIKSQCTAPSFTVDLRAAIDTTAIISNQVRGGVCCGSSNCVTFLVYSNSSSDLIGFDVTNPSPSGSAYYQVNCGAPVSIGTPLCIKGLASPFTITYCKPGGDSPDYVITAGKTVHGSDDISIQKTGCKDTLFVSNVTISSIVWTSIYPGIQGAYNSYLSCTAGCNSTIVTPGTNPPPYIDFKVSGSPNVACGSFTSDTIRVYFVNVITGTITPLNPVICSTSGSVLTLTANASGGAVPYKYDWSNVAGPNNSYTTTASTAGTYSVIITDQTKCPAIILTKVIGTIPVTTFSYSGSSSGFCKGDPNPVPVFGGAAQPGLFSATPSGLIFVSTSTGVINLAASNSGTYIVTNTISPSGSCSGSSSTTTITIYPFPIMTSVSTATICSGNSVTIPLSSSNSSNFTWIATDNINITGESVTAQTTAVLSNTLINSSTSNESVVYTVTPISNLAGNCVGTAQVINVTVRPLDDAAFSYPSSTNCKTGTNTVATITGLPGGTFSAGPGLVFLNSAGTINLLASSIGSYTVTYTTNGICPNSYNFPVTITTAPIAGFNFIASPYCQSAANPLPTYSPSASGGTFSSATGLVFVNNLTGEIDLLASTPGTYTVTNTIAPSGLCGTSSATAVVTITKLKEAGFSYTASPICQTATNPFPTFTTNGEAGTFSSGSGLIINSANGLVDLLGSTPGTYSVVNTIAASGGCPVVNDTSRITITQLPVATFNYPGTPFCSNSSNPLPTFTGLGTAGLFNASSVYLNLNSTNGLVDILNSLPGDYIITNSIAASNGCPAVVASASLTITELPNGIFGYSGTPLCSNLSNQTPTLNINGSNGLYTSTPSGLSIDPNSGTIDMSTSTSGTYIITNTIGSANGCPAVVTNFPLMITQLPIATFSYPLTPYCINGSNPSPSFTGAGISGTFSATSGILVNPSNGLVDLSGSSAGTFTVTNTIAASNGCPVVIETNVITINPIATVSAGIDGVMCANQTFTLFGGIGGAASTLLWTTNGSGSFNNPTSPSAFYTPSASDILNGSVILTIETDDPTGPCPLVTDAMLLTINPTPTASAGSTNTLTCSSMTLSLSGSGGDSYAWSGPGIISGSNTANPSINIPGTYSLVVTSTLSCESEISTVQIFKDTISPIVFSASTGSLNCTTLSVDLSATTSVMPVNYNWNGPGIISSATTSTITINTGGTYNYTVTNTVNNCTTSGAVSITQNTVVPITVALTSGSITCTTNTVGLGSSLAGMNYAWIAPSGCSIVSGSSSQNCVGQGLGTYSVTITDPTNDCTFSTFISTIQDTTAPTAVSAGSNQSLICGIPTVTLSGTATPSNSIINWLGGVCGAVNSCTTTACAPQTYTMFVTHPVTGCIATSTVAVVSSTDMPQATLNAITNSITCTNDSVTVGVTLNNSDPVSYSWSGPGIAGASNTAVITTTASGTYSIVITNTVTNCQAIYNAVVPTNTTPVTVSMTPASSITCSSPSITLNVSPVGSQYTYSWNGPGILSGGTTTNPVVDLGGNFDVTITNTISGCTGTATVSVPSNTIIPSILISTPSITTTCANPTATLNCVATPSTDVIYSWTAPLTGSLNNTTISNPIASGSGIFTVVATNTVTGCVSSSISQSTIEVIPDLSIPNATLSAASVSITCSNPSPSVIISTNTGNASYSWTPISGIVAGTENTASPSFSLAGTYSVVVTDANSGCSTFITNNIVTVSLDNTIPVVIMTGSVNKDTINCKKATVSVTPIVSPNTNLTYIWTSSNGSGISSATNQASATFTSGGVYTMVATNTITGCSSITNALSTFTVYMDTIAPVCKFDFTTGCPNDSVKFTDSSLGGITKWNWSFGNGNSSSLQNPANTYSTSSTYTVALQVQATNGCTNSSSKVVTLIPPVIANYSSNGNAYLTNQTISFANQSSGANGYVWNFGDGGSDQSTDPSHTYTAIGNYPVTLVATNSIGCKDSITYLFEIKSSGYAIPGGFTPNNDGMNDGFSVLGGPFDTYELRVFNAWGNELFKTNSQIEKWDGSYRDTQQPAGTYIYIFNGKMTGGENLKLKGEVHIIR